MHHTAALLAARTLAAARRSGQRITALPDDAIPQNLDDAYQIQDLSVTCAGAAIGAWKVGATHPNAQAGLGVPGPVASRLASGIVHKAGHTLDDTFLIRGLEAEYAFLLRADLPPADAPYTRAQVADAIASVHPAIEVVDTRFTTPQRAPLAIADNVNDGALLYGPGLSDWRTLDIVGAPVTMAVNGEVVVRGSGAEVLGDPLASLMWLVNEHAAVREGLRAGQLITSGSCTGLHPAPAGCTATASFEGLGELSVRFAS